MYHYLHVYIKHSTSTSNFYLYGHSFPTLQTHDY